MEIIRVGIVGYGNLGRSLEKLIVQDSRFKLVKTFEKNDTMTSDDKLNISFMRKFEKKIDVMFVCVGSKSALEKVALPLSRYFNIVDAYDNHKRIKNYLDKMDTSCIKHNHTSVCCCGWDPGLFSMMRLIFKAVEGNSYTFWGKGVSQGHTQAVKEVAGVKNGIQYTLPNTKILKAIKNGDASKAGNLNMHKRLVYVEASGNRKVIKERIKNMPDYFAGYQTQVKFVKKLDSSPRLYHAGEVLTLGNTMNFSVKMESNPLFTAKILKAYALALVNLHAEGVNRALSILDIAPKYLLIDDYKQYI